MHSVALLDWIMLWLSKKTNWMVLFVVLYFDCVVYVALVSVIKSFWNLKTCSGFLIGTTHQLALELHIFVVACHRVVVLYNAN